MTTGRGAVDDGVDRRRRRVGGRHHHVRRHVTISRRRPRGRSKRGARTSRPARGLAPAYATTTPPWPVSTPGTAWRASSMSTWWAPTGAANRSTVSTPRPASRAISAGERRPLGARARATSGSVASVSQSGDDAGLADPADRGRQPPQRRRGRRSSTGPTSSRGRCRWLPAMVVNVAPAGARSAADASSPITSRGSGEVKPSRG